MKRNDSFEDYFSKPRAAENERARVRRSLDNAPAPSRLRDTDDLAVLRELRAMRSEVASLRDLVAERGPSPAANDEILTRKQAAELLSVCIESITKLVRDERLPCKRVGKEYRFLRSQVLSWLAERDDAQVSERDDDAQLSEAHGCT